MEPKEETTGPSAVPSEEHPPKSITTIPPGKNGVLVIDEEDAMHCEKKRKEELQLLALQAQTEVARAKKEAAMERAAAAEEKAMLRKYAYYDLKIKLLMQQQQTQKMNINKWWTGSLSFTFLSKYYSIGINFYLKLFYLMNVFS